MTAASDHPDVPATVDQTAACEAGNCHRCRGTVLSVTAAHGRPCGHACHRGDDRAIEAALERHHFDDPFDLGYGDARARRRAGRVRPATPPRGPRTTRGLRYAGAPIMAGQSP